MKKKIGIIMLALTLSLQSFVGCNGGATETYDVSVSGAGTNGTVTIDKTKVEMGGDVLFKVTPAENYRVKEFLINGYPVTLFENEYTEYGVMEDLSATVVFEYALVTVSFDTGTDEDIADKTVTKMESYGTLPTPTASEGKIFKGWYTQANGEGNLIKASSRVQATDTQTLYAYFAEPISVDMSEIDPEDYTPYALTTTYYDSAATRFGITYHTEERCEYPIVQYVKGTTDDFTGANVQTINCDTEKSTINDYRYTAELPALESSTAYSVRVGDTATGIFGKVYQFTTKAAITTSSDLKFMYVADTQEDDLQDMAGENVTYWSKMVDQAVKFFPASQTNFMAHGGDLTNYGSEKAYWAEMLGSVGNYMFDMPLVQAPGNHEESWTYGGGNYNIMYNMYNINLPPQDTSNGYYYSFDIGSMHFVVLNTNEAVAFNNRYGDNGTILAGGKASEGIADIKMGAGQMLSEQINWIKSDLKKAKANPHTKWTVAMMHEGLVIPTFGTNYSIAHAYVLRQQLMKTLDECDVDLVLNGHNHYIQTTNPLQYDAAGEIKIKTVDDGSANGNKTLYERLLKITDSTYTLNTGIAGYEGIELVDFGNDYVSGTGGTIFHQIATAGNQYKVMFKQSELASNLTRYNGLYNNLRSGGAGANDTSNYSMFSYIEIDGEKDQLVLRNYGVDVNKEYSPTGEQLKYFGGFIVRK